MPSPSRRRTRRCRRAPKPRLPARLSQANDVTRCESGGVIDERGTYTTSDSKAALKHLVGCPKAFTPIVRPYPATVDAAGPQLRSRLEWTETGNVL